MTATELFVFDANDKLLCITDKYLSAVFEETVETPVGLTVEIPFENADAEYLVGGNQVAFRDLEGRFRLFIIREVDDENGKNFKKTICCMPAIHELADVIIEERRPQNQTAEYVLTLILAASRWKVGDVADLGRNSTSFYYENALICLQRLTEVWGGEVIDRIEIENNMIVDRYIDIVYRKGRDSGKRFEIDKDIKSIKRTILHYPKTALYAKGSSIELETGGYSRKITFASVEYSKAKGDPFDKPLGQEWVGDNEARELYGIPTVTGEKMHRFGMFEDMAETDPEQLLLKTWAALQEENKPKVQYKLSVDTFHGIAGYEHETVRLGDTGIIYDDNVKPAILVESRVMSLKYDLGDRENGEIILGNILTFDSEEKALRDVIDTVKDRSGIWNKGAEPIKDIAFPDIKPPAPENVYAEGLFKVIQVSWAYRPDSYIAAYEVYASKINGFVPDETNRVYRGKTGGYVHHADTNEMWYFRIRAVNYHGTASDFSPQVSARTVSVDAGDITPKVITNDLIAENAQIDGAKIAEATITNAHITGVLEASKIKVGETEEGEIKTLDNEFPILETRINNAEIELQPDSITSKVMLHENFVEAMNKKADEEELANYTPIDDFNTLNEQVSDIAETVGNIDLSPYVTHSELDQKADSITARFTKQGGVNLIKNSVGYAGLDFWTVEFGSVMTITNEELESLGFGRGFYSPVGVTGDIYQDIPVIPYKNYSVSVYIKKTVDHPEDSCSRIILYDGANFEQEIGTIGYRDGEMGDYGYEHFAMTFTPTQNIVRLVIRLETNCNAILTGLMMNVGDISLPWTTHSGERYNANVRMDLNGIRVSHQNGATIMTPERFAGYFDVNGDGIIDIGKDSPDEVFRMDKDEFVMKKTVAKEEITLGSVKVVYVESENNRGWAFVPVD